MRYAVVAIWTGLFGIEASNSLQAEDQKVAPKGYYDMGSPQAAAMLKKFPSFVILDIRTPKEFAAGHLKGAKNVDFFGADFAAQLKKLDKKKGYLVHCASGGRSGKSMKQFKDQGFTTIYHIDDGYRGWTTAKLPVVNP
jgi:rhodanese-related sulfurtransferase